MQAREILKSPENEQVSTPVKGEWSMKSGKIRVGKNVLRAAVVFILLGGSIACSLYMKYAGQERKTVLFSTDIAIDGDFDDYFDLVVMKSMEGVDLKIIVDGNDSAQKQSGQDAVRNLEKITGGGVWSVFGHHRERS